MILDSVDDDSDSDFLSIGGDDVDVYLNHYRIPKLNNFGSNGSHQPAKVRSNREQVKYVNEGEIMSLVELAAQKVACHLPFGQVDHYHPLVDNRIQCRIAFWSFPQDEEDIRLYTCLANGNADVFLRAEDLIGLNSVCDMLQVGFHLSANVKVIQDSTDNLDYFRVAITFDRRRITSCSCSCSASTFWCQHVVAVCLQRIRKPQEVTLRAPVSDSLYKLNKDQLQKFAQYLINELPQQILPAAQKLLDELAEGDSFINQDRVAPDPTAGALIDEQTNWCLDDTHLSIDIQKILLKQCTAQPTVCSDIQALHTTAPPAATEYSQLLRPIRGREPEGLWNLISIVGEMMKRRDSNFFFLLEIMTEEMLKCEKIVTWWFETKVSLHSGSTIHCSNAKNNSQCTAQYSCSNFCDEVAHLWRLAAMNPGASGTERKRLYKKFFDWHLEILKRHSALPDNGMSSTGGMKPSKRNFLELFPGFKPSMEGCLIDWSDWDDKRGVLVSVTEGQEADNTKSSKSSKKRKKKSKSAKQNASESQPSTSSQQINEERPEQQPSQDEALRITTKNDAGKPCVAESQIHLVGVDDDRADQENKVADLNEEGSSSKIHQPTSPGIEESDISGRRTPFRDMGNLQPRAENDDSQPGSDPPQIPRIEQDLQVYFMDKSVENSSKTQKPESFEDYIKVNVKKLNDPLEILYAKTEGLYAHGHLEEARNLAFRAANEILNHPNYPSSKQLCILPRRRKKKGSLDNQMSIVASVALSKIAFLCSVLIDDPNNHNLVFRLVLFGVEMKRSPASTKPLEVKLINQKHDLIMILKSIALHEDELVILREKAQALRDGLCENNSNALTTLILGNYIFEALVLSKSPACSNCNTRPAIENARSGSTSSYSQAGSYQLEEHYLPPVDQQSSSHNADQIRQPCSLIVYGKLPFDTSLGFHAALNAIGAKMNLLEIDHPLLCEGTRRQRGELALSLLSHYKDDQEKLDLILKHLLDKDVVLSPPATDGVERPTGATSSSANSNAKKANLTHDPNLPTEASAHFMFELAKTVFDKAGGNIMTAHLFRPQLVSQNGGRGIHRKLHMCALRIALYALGLQNRTSANWMQRTYSGRASFIIEQALEIGLPAIKYLCESWEGHLTPVEVASIADKAGCSNDSETKRVAAEMAKSSLKCANNLDFNAVRRILAQSKEQSVEMIEEACCQIEQVAETESVCADVLFATARAWYSLYEKLVKDEHQAEHGCCQLKDNNLSSDSDALCASDWIVASNDSRQECSQINQETIHPKHWDFYDSRVEFIPSMYAPTYKHIEYIKAAYRVGIKALDSLKSSLHVSNKHNPKKEDDVLWLLWLSKLLGRDCLHQFTRSAIKNITNPQLLHIISTDLINFFEMLPQYHIDRINMLLPLIDKCLDRFVKQTRDLMKHISYDQTSYIDSILGLAKDLTETAHTLTAVGHFKELLRVVDSKRIKKFRMYIDTHDRHAWVDDLLSTIKHCPCTQCRTGREGNYRKGKNRVY